MYVCYMLFNKYSVLNVHGLVNNVVYDDLELLHLLQLLPLQSAALVSAATE